jgi:ketosteroid isomerase-like protein
MATDPLQYVSDLEQIRALPQRYARAVDARDFDAVGALFHPEAEVEGMRGSAPIAGYLEAMRAAPSPFTGSMHMLGDPLVQLEPGAAEASSDTYAVVYQLRAPDAPEGNLTLGMRYFDNLVRHDGQWLIRHRRTANLWMTGTLPS